MKMEVTEEREIVIVGGGICGLATALALHRKGIESVILEKSKTIRATGAAIIVQPNGWHALHQLGLASSLQRASVPLLSGLAISLEDGKHKYIPICKGELRCLKRIDLMNALVENLPSHAIRLGCHVLSVEFDSLASSLVVQLDDGRKIRGKVVIGCDGVNSVMATKLGLSCTKRFSTSVIRGFTDYATGHELGNKFLVWNKHNVQLGLFPISRTLVYWFITRKLSPQDFAIPREQRIIKELAVGSLSGFPAKAIEMVKKSEGESLHMTDLKYRAPWGMFGAKLRKGSITVAGDAMHAMGPFLAQGGSASLEDAVILARCLSHRRGNAFETKTAEAALDEYVKQRRMRVFWLSLQTFLIGKTIDSTSLVHKLVIVLLLTMLFRDETAHSTYRCGTL